MVAERELDTLDRVGRQLQKRLHDMRAALLLIARNGGVQSSDIASRALRDDELTAGQLVEAVIASPIDERVACIRCKIRERAPGSAWCRFCAPARNATAGRD